MTTYYKGSGVTWHWHRNCTRFPLNPTAISYTKPVSGELCNECRAREATCSEVRPPQLPGTCKGEGNNNSFSERSEKLHVTTNAILHYRYMILFLLVVIVFLLTLKGTQATLLDYIFFSTAITSLILSMLTIIFSFVSNEYSKQQNLSITQALTGLNLSNGELNNLTWKINEIIKNEINSATKGILTQDVFMEQIQRVNSLNRANWKRPDGEGEKGDKGVKKDTRKSPSQKDIVSLDFSYSSFFENGSQGLNVILYLITLANETQIPFIVKDIFNSTLYSTGFCEGVMSSLKACSLIDFNRNNKGCYLMTKSSFGKTSVELLCYFRNILDGESKEFFSARQKEICAYFKIAYEPII